MGLYFRRSVKLLPGLKLNFGKKSTSVTVGSKLGRVTYGKGRTTYSTGVPGTGVYYRKTVSDNKKAHPTNTAYSPQQEVPERTKAENNTWGAVFLIIGAVIILMAFMASLVTVGRIFIGAIGVFCLLGSIAFFTAKSSDDPDPSTTGNESSLIKNKFGFAVGLVLLIIFGYMFFASFGWSWQDHSKHNIYIVYHFDWLKWIFYPVVLAAMAFGGLCTYASLVEDESEDNTTIDNGQN